MKNNLWTTAMAMLALALSYSCADNEQELLEPETNTFSIGNGNYDISTVKRCKEPAGGEYYFFKITGETAGGTIPTIYFKYSGTQFGKTVDIAKTNSLMFFIYAELTTENTPVESKAIMDYDNRVNRWFTEHPMDASGTLGITKYSGKKYRINFAAVIDDVSYKCDFLGDISDIYFD